MEPLAIFAENFEAERAEHEFNKYGRSVEREAVANPARDKRHSMPEPYGQYDRPINEAV